MGCAQIRACFKILNLNQSILSKWGGAPEYIKSLNIHPCSTCFSIHARQIPVSDLVLTNHTWLKISGCINQISEIHTILKCNRKIQIYIKKYVKMYLIIQTNSLFF